MSVPPRVALCLQCRTALVEGETCDQSDEHAAVTMADLYGREALIATVWGPVRDRLVHHQESYRARQSLSGLAMAGAAVGMIATTLLVPGADMALMLGSGVASSSLFWGAGKASMAKKPHKYPVGADSLRLRTGAGRGVRGHIEADTELESPATASACVAYALELSYEGLWGERVMFRDAVTAAMTVVLDDGAVVSIPAGRIRLLGPLYQEIDVDIRHLDDYLRAFDSRRSSRAEFDPLHHNVVYEKLLIAGDRVELVSELETVLAPDTRETHYRESPASMLVPRGVPVVRLLGRQE